MRGTIPSGFKNLSISLTKHQNRVIEYLQGEGMSISSSEFFRDAMWYHFYNFSASKVGFNVNVNLEDLPANFFKNVPIGIVKGMLNDDTDAMPSFSVNLTRITWDWLDQVRLAKRESRSAYMRDALNEYLKRCLIMVETMSREMNNANMTGIKLLKTSKKSKNPVDMRKKRFKQ